MQDVEAPLVLKKFPTLQSVQDVKLSHDEQAEGQAKEREEIWIKLLS